MAKKISPKLQATSELVDIASLKPHPRNYRQHHPDQLAHIVASLKAHGFYRNVVVAADGTILAGHGVVEASKQLGLEQVPVIRLPVKPTDPRALKVLTGDNEISNLGEVNDRLLSEILREVGQSEEGLLGTGFDEKQLANLVFVTRHESEIADLDAAAEWVGLPAYDAGGEKKSSRLCVVVFFDTEKDREAFVAEKKLKLRVQKGRQWETNWPFTERRDLKAVKFK